MDFPKWDKPEVKVHVESSYRHEEGWVAVAWATATFKDPASNGSGLRLVETEPFQDRKEAERMAWGRASQLLQRAGDESMLESIKLRPPPPLKPAKRSPIRPEDRGQEVLPKQEEGVIHSGPARVLVRKGEKRLIIRQGGSYWSGRSPQYAPSSLSFYDGGIRGSWGKEIHPSLHEGRVSRKVVESNMDKIREFLEEPSLTADQIDLKKTLVLP